MPQNSLSDTHAQSVLEFLFRGQAYAPPANLYVGAFAAGVEIVGNGYARVQYDPSAVNFTYAKVGENRQVSNASAIAFAPADGGAWANIDELRLMTAAVDGDVFAHGPITQRTVNPPDVLEVAAGEWKISMPTGV